MESSELIAVKNEKNEIQCLFIPKLSSNIRNSVVDGYNLLQYEINYKIVHEKSQIIA